MNGFIWLFFSVIFEKTPIPLFDAFSGTSNFPGKLSIPLSNIRDNVNWS